MSKFDISTRAFTSEYILPNVINNGELVFDSSTKSVWLSNSNSTIKFNLGSTNYLNSPGTYISGIIDLGAKTSLFSTLSYTSTVPANTGIAVDIRAGDSNTVDGTWTNYIEGVSSGGDISALGSHKYVQYRVTLTTSDSSATPILNDITIGYDSYALSQSLTSSAYDSADIENIIGAIGWTEDISLPSGSGVIMSIRTASSQVDLSSSAYYDFTSTTTHCEKTDAIVTCPASALPSDLKSGGDDQ